MGQVQRFRMADAKRVRRFAVDAATVIEVGDMMWQATDDVRPPSSFPYVAGSLPRTQANFRRDFAGVAIEGKKSTDPAGLISVATRGTFELDCPSATFEIGDRVGMEDNAGATALINQTVIALGENGSYGEVGRVVKRYSVATTRVLVEIDTLVLRPQDTEIITMFEGTIDVAEDLVTDWIPEFPFKLMAVRSIVTVATTVATTIITIRKGATALDDTHSIPVSAKGVFARSVMDDATGDDRFDAESVIDIASDGGATVGSALIQFEIVPFLHES